MSEEAVIAAGSAAASVAGSVLDYKQNKKNQKLAEKQRKENMALIEKYGSRVGETLTPGYQNAQDARQQAMNQNMENSGLTFKQSNDVMQSGDYMKQQAIMAGLMGQRNATLGDPIDYSALSPQNVPMDYSALTGLTNPQGLDFKAFQTPEYGSSTNTQAQENWSSGDAAQYLKNYPDLSAYYEKNKRELIKDSGNDTFNSLEGYAKWHWDNYGKAGGRTFQPLATADSTTNSTAKEPAKFTSEQVRAALGEGQENSFGFDGVNA
jgi:hypothetical protein